MLFAASQDQNKFSSQTGILKFVFKFVSEMHLKNIYYILCAQVNIYLLQHIIFISIHLLFIFF